MHNKHPNKELVTMAGGAHKQDPTPCERLARASVVMMNLIDEIEDIRRQMDCRKEENT